MNHHGNHAHDVQDTGDRPITDEELNDAVGTCLMISSMIGQSLNSYPAVYLECIGEVLISAGRYGKRPEALGPRPDGTQNTAHHFANDEKLLAAVRAKLQEHEAQLAARDAAEAAAAG